MSGQNDTQLAPSENKLAALAERMAQAHVRGQWQNEANRQATTVWIDDLMLPIGRGKPYLWAAHDMQSFLDEAAEALPESMTARRSVLCNNPGLQRGTVATINMGIQMILPGEVAWAHRHSISALRFVIRGDTRLATTVDGTVCPMESGDLILTPGGTWHDHFNGGDEPLMWLDVLDGPVLNAINQTVFQNFGDKRQAPRNEKQHEGTDSSAELRFAWSTVETALSKRTLDQIDPCQGHVYDYLDAASGRHPMRTLGCRMHLLPGGFEGQTFRCRPNAVFHAFRGDGRVEIDGETLHWRKGDCFAIPGWCERRITIPDGNDCYLFEVHDEPLLINLGLLGDELSATVQDIQKKGTGAAPT